MALKFLDADGEGNTADAANAIDYAVSHGARVINASWGGPAFSQALYSGDPARRRAGRAVRRGRRQRRRERRLQPDYPAAFDLPNVISVAATDRDDRAGRLLELRRQERRPRAPRATTSTRPSRPSPTRAATRPSAAPRWRRPFVSRRGRPLPLASSRRRPWTRCAPRSSDRRPAAHAGGQDRHRRPAERRQGARRRSAVHAPRPARHAPPPSAFALIRPRNRLETRKRGAALRLAALARRERDPLLPAVRGRQARAKTVRDKDGPGGTDPKPRRALRLRGGQAPLVRARLRLRRQPAARAARSSAPRASRKSSVAVRTPRSAPTARRA